MIQIKNRRDIIVNVNSKLKQIKNILCTKDENYIFFVKVNSDKSLDVMVKNEIHYFRNFIEFIDASKPIKNRAIIIILDDFNLLN